MGMSETYVCCFCGNAIDKSDEEAVELIATNLWAREAAQCVYSHSACAEERMAAGQLSPSVLLDGDKGYSLEGIVWGENEAPRYYVSGWTCLGLLIAFAIGGCLLLLR
jgi:hypothetical protein